MVVAGGWILQLYWRHGLTATPKFKDELRDRLRARIQNGLTDDVEWDENDDAWLEDLLDGYVEDLEKRRTHLLKTGT